MDDTQLFRRQVRWQMRRGLLELDLLMRRFIAGDFDALTDTEVRDLAQVLTWNDQQLLAVLQEREENPEPRLAEILAKIRRCVKVQSTG